MKIWNGYQKGVNLGGWFSQCDHSKDRYDNFIKEDDFAVIKSWGADHVRLLIDGIDFDVSTGKIRIDADFRPSWERGKNCKDQKKESVFHFHGVFQDGLEEFSVWFWFFSRFGFSRQRR